ncbi:MAG: hypothetical protein ACE5IY_01315 [bacterium]
MKRILDKQNENCKQNSEEPATLALPLRLPDSDCKPVFLNFNGGNLTLFKQPEKRSRHSYGQKGKTTILQLPEASLFTILVPPITLTQGIAGVGTRQHRLEVNL